MHGPSPHLKFWEGPSPQSPKVSAPVPIAARWLALGADDEDDFVEEEYDEEERTRLVSPSSSFIGT